MTGLTVPRLWLLPKRQPFSKRSVVHQSPIRHDPANVSHEPSPSQLLRFALTGTTQPCQGRISGPDLDSRLQELFHGEWPLNIPPPSWSLLQPGATERNAEILSNGLSHDVQSVRQLQTLIERNVVDTGTGAILQSSHCSLLSRALERCQRYNPSRDILSAINGIIARLEVLDVPIYCDLQVLGMQYACLCHLVPAFKRHLEGYYSISSKCLDLHSSISLVNALLYFIDTVRFEDPGYNVSCVLSLITGEDNPGLPFQHKLHDILCWTVPESSTDSIGQYAILLAKLGSCATLQKVWDRFLDSLVIESPLHVFHSAYACILALVDARRSEVAVNCLKQLSKRANGTLPGVSRFQRLSALLADQAVQETLPQLVGKQELVGILEKQMKTMEDRLGIKWQSDKSHHSSISDPVCVASGRSLFTMDGDSTGFDSKNRFIAEVRALGCSKSPADLGMIANLLDEHEDSEIPVSLPNSRDTPFEFAWILQRSPIEAPGEFPTSSRADTSIPWSPRSLGLICVRLINDGIVLASECSLHLMQLGYLAMRPTLQSDEANHERPCTWQPSGHVVALDRASGQFLVFFVGKDHGFFDPVIQAPSLPFQCGLGAVADIALPGDDDSSGMTLGNRPFPFGNSSARFHLEVDPSPDLNF